MSSELIEYFKQSIDGKYVMEIKVWRVSDERYQLGLKFSLIFIDPRSGKRVLIDNHYPKKPHLHIDDVEHPYKFKDTTTLIDDFKKQVESHFGVEL